MRCVRPTCAHLWMNGQPSCRAVPEAEHLAELARSDGDSRRRACFGRSVIGARWGVVFPTARVTSRLWCLSSASSGPRAISRATHHACEHAGRNRPRPTRAPCLVKARGLLGRGHLRSGGSRPLERPRVPSSATVLHSRAVPPCGFAGRDHDTRSLPAVMLLLSSRPIDLAVGRPVFSRRCALASRGCETPCSKDGKSPSMVASSSAIDVLRLRRLPLRMHAHRPESPVSRGVALQR